MADSERTDEGLIKPPIIMKIDAPKDDCSKPETSDNENNEAKSEEEFKICNPSNPFRSSSTNPFSMQNKFSRGILKPPQLSLNHNSSSPSKSPFVLKPSSLNPFAMKSTENKTSDNSDKNLDKKQVNGETLKFVPLVKNDSENKPVQTNQTSSVSSVVSSNTTFVFGQNLHDRVVAAENKCDEPKPSTSLSTNGSSEMLFSNAVKHDVKTDLNPKEKESKTLSESAREYEESRANKRKYEEVEVRTGEEEEVNILSISCKLFAFDKITSSWQERGRGTLRLNDFEIEDGLTGSRLVFRTAGSLRVILNTKIWAEMTVDKASDKSIRLTALDSNGEVKVFLIMGTIEDSKHLYLQLQSRLQKEVVAQKRKKTLDTSDSKEIL